MTLDSQYSVKHPTLTHYNSRINGFSFDNIHDVRNNLHEAYKNANVRCVSEKTIEI